MTITLSPVIAINTVTYQMLYTVLYHPLCYYWKLEKLYFIYFSNFGAISEQDI